MMSGKGVCHFASRTGVLATILLCTATSAATAGTFDNLMREFEQSEIDFQRTKSNAPFVPIAYLGATYYDDIDLSLRGAGSLRYDHSEVSQAAGVPVLIGDRDALIVGEYLSVSRFDARSPGRESFDVYSVGIPVGWLRQASDAWQLAGFVMPLGHKATLDNASWQWEYMGGAFARYVQNDHLWWAVGAFVDLGPGDDLVLPYLGASWAVSEEWLISAVMPWPGISYAPTPDTFFRLGMSPSGTSWSLQPEQGDLSFELDAWDFGISAGHRLAGRLWGQLDAGVGGLRGLSISNDRVNEPDIEISSSPYIGISVAFRP